MLEAQTGRVVPAPDGPHVEQVGWGVARQVARELEPADRADPAGAAEVALLADIVRLAETAGFLAYAVFERRTAVAVALVSLPGDPDLPATYVGDVVAPGAPDGVREALLVRALHDTAEAGVRRLAVPEPRLDLRPFGFVG